MKQGLLVLVFLSIITPFAHAQRKPSARPAVDSRRTADASQMAGFKRLRAASAGKAEIKLERGAVRFATLDVRVPAGASFRGGARSLAGGSMTMSAPRRSARFGINDDEVRYYLLVTPSPNADPKQAYRVSVKLKGAVRRS